jgi:hypothetical protein
MTQSQGSIEQMHLFGEQKNATFTNHDKLACVRREADLRKRVYASLVRNGRMSPEKAKWEIDVMEAIAADYRQALIGQDGRS